MSGMKAVKGASSTIQLPIRASTSIAPTNRQLLAEREAFLRTAFEDNAEAARLADVQYEVGAIDLLSVLQIQARQFQSESALVRIQGTRLANRVNLHLALGGSFEVVEPEP